jgi:hypothetical protein
MTRIIPTREEAQYQESGLLQSSFLPHASGGTKPILIRFESGVQTAFFPSYSATPSPASLSRSFENSPSSSQ